MTLPPQARRQRVAPLGRPRCRPRRARFPRRLRGIWPFPVLPLPLLPVPADFSRVRILLHRMPAPASALRVHLRVRLPDYRLIVTEAPRLRPWRQLATRRVMQAPLSPLRRALCSPANDSGRACGCRVQHHRRLRVSRPLQRGMVHRYCCWSGMHRQQSLPMTPFCSFPALCKVCASPFVRVCVRARFAGWGLSGRVATSDRLHTHTFDVRWPTWRSEMLLN